MGLARDALLSLRQLLGAELFVPEPQYDASVADGKASDEALPSTGAIVRLRGIIRSLPRG